jgi:hypothetical protein
VGSANGIVLSELIEAKGEAMFRHALPHGPGGDCIQAARLGHVSGRTRHRQQLKTEFSAMLQKVSHDERQHA